MGKSTQEVDIASSQQLTKKMLIFYMFNIFYWVSDVTFGTFPVYKPFKNMGKNTQKVDKGEQPAPVPVSSQ